MRQCVVRLLISLVIVIRGSLQESKTIVSHSQTRINGRRSERDIRLPAYTTMLPSTTKTSGNRQEPNEVAYSSTHSMENSGNEQIGLPTESIQPAVTRGDGSAEHDQGNVNNLRSYERDQPDNRLPPHLTKPPIMAWQFRHEWNNALPQQSKTDNDSKIQEADRDHDVLTNSESHDVDQPDTRLHPSLTEPPILASNYAEGNAVFQQPAANESSSSDSNDYNLQDTDSEQTHRPVNVDDYFLNQFTSILYGFVATDMNQSRHDRNASESPFKQFLVNANCTEGSCLMGSGDAETHQMSDKDIVPAEVAPTNPSTQVKTNSLMNFGANRAVTTLQTRYTGQVSGVTSKVASNLSAIDDDSGDPRSFALSGIGILLDIYAISREDFADDTTELKTPNVTTLLPRLMMFHPMAENTISPEDWHLEGISETSDVLSALGRCGIFPACKLKITTPEVADQAALEYERTIEKDLMSHPSNLKKVVEVVCDPTSVSIIASVAIILSIIIIISNLVIIIVTLRTKSLRKPHGYFKISLALADLVNGAFVLSNISSNLVQDIHFDNRDLEQIEQIRRVEPNYSEAAFFGVSAVMSQVVTVYSVLLLSVDSFLSIRWPMQYRVGDLMTAKRAVALIAVVWTFALAVSALPLLAKNYVSYGLSFTTYSYFPVISPLSKHMSHDDAFHARYVHAIVYAVLVWGIPFVATWILTMLTAYYSRGMLRRMSSARKKGPQFSKTIGRLERDILRTVSIVLTLLTITVLPMIVALFTILVNININILCLEQNVTNLLFGAYYVLACGSFVNVIVYNACHKEFRRSMFDFLCDMITFLFAGCCPKYCDMQSVKSSSYRRKNASARETKRTTLDTRKYRNRVNALELQYNTSHGDRNATIRSSTLPVGSIGLNSTAGVHADFTSKERTLSTETTVTSIRDRCMSSASAGTPRIPRKTVRHQKSCSLSDVFMSSTNDGQHT